MSLQWPVWFLTGPDFGSLGRRAEKPPYRCMMRTLLLWTVFISPVVAAPIPAPSPPDPMGRAWLGVYEDQNVRPRQLPSGAWVGRIIPGTPAAKSGIKEGDKILKIGKKEVLTFQDVVGIIGTYRPGAILELEIQRGDKKMPIKVKLDLRPNEIPQQPDPDNEP